MLWSGMPTNPTSLPPDCPKPTDDPNFVPVISKRQIKEPHVWTPGGALQCWATHYLQIDPAYDGYYFEDDLLEWACKIADQEGITLGAMYWPASLCGVLIRSGFKKSLGLVGMHRPPGLDRYDAMETGHGHQDEHADKERLPGEF